MAPRQTPSALLLFLSCFAGRATASAFLGKGGVVAAAAGTHLHLLEELEGALGVAHRAATERRMSRLEAALHPTVAALPRGADGRLGHVAVRYVLHRLFVEKHGWYVRGLAPAGDTWNSSSPIAVLQGTAPQAVFEGRLANHTFSFHEVAVLAATLENLVHEETLERLSFAFKVHGIQASSASLTEAQLGEVIDTQMIFYVTGKSDASQSPKQAREAVSQVYPNWPETARFVRDVRREVLDRSDADTRALTFDDAVRVVEEIGERYGRWQDRECRELKHDLVKLEHQGTGRVLLKDFYGAAAAGAWQFSESVNYLRQLGALDEADPAHLKVIIANYVNAPSNCLASSSYYSVCCIDECEALLGQIEHEVAAPEAAPARLAEVIAALPSATVGAPRDLPASLRDRLEEIARHHGDSRVPLHSRLFAQVMHHAYPRECSFPHVTGTTQPQTVEEWMSKNGEGSTTATREEMRQHIENTLPRGDGAELPWIEEEELLIVRPAVHGTPGGEGRLRSAVRCVAAVAALLSLSVLALSSLAPAGAALKADPSKYYV